VTTCDHISSNCDHCWLKSKKCDQFQGYCIKLWPFFLHSIDVWPVLCVLMDQFMTHDYLLILLTTFKGLSNPISTSIVVHNVILFSHWSRLQFFVTNEWLQLIKFQLFMPSYITWLALTHFPYYVSKVFEKLTKKFQLLDITFLCQFMMKPMWPNFWPIYDYICDQLSRNHYSSICIFNRIETTMLLPILWLFMTNLILAWSVAMLSHAFIWQIHGQCVTP
jgi:hypothetical protein